jgi:signal transduction histidine kinase
VELIGQKNKILVVEDDGHLLEGIRDILELDGYEVLTAQNGVEGLQVLRNHATPPDVIVSDIMMPQMDGVEFLNEVRKEAQWLMIPFIFLTAKGEKSDYRKGMKLGVDDYVIKPYDPTDLLIKIESRLQRHRKINEAQHNLTSDLKRRILTILNHEFRTPLTFVVAYSDMLKNKEEMQLTDDEIMAYLKGVSSGADRLRNLVENFITLVEMETGEARQTFSWRKIPIMNPDLLFATACERVKELAAGQNPFTMDIERDIPTFMGDQDYLIAALTHLLSNAVKFSEKGKPVKMGARVVGDDIHLWVEDEGRGIPIVEQGHIWESFYQINRDFHEDQGAGAGLPIVRGVADIHGGRVDVTSKPDVGSTFTIVLPLQPPAA